MVCFHISQIFVDTTVNEQGLDKAGLIKVRSLTAL